MSDVTGVHVPLNVVGLTFELPREVVLAMLDRKVEIMGKAAEAWQEAATSDEYLDRQSADARKKAAEKNRAEGIPPQMAASTPQRDAITQLCKKNVRTMHEGMEKWRIQRKYLSSLPVFTLTQEHLMFLAVDDVDKLYPPEWPGVTD